jgi:hypothetical protein
MPTTKSTPRKKSDARKKPRAEPAPEPEPEPEPDEESAAEEAQKTKKTPEQLAEDKKNKLKRRRSHKRLSGYRLKAKECGFNKDAGLIAASGVDVFTSALNLNDGKRLMTFVPQLGKESSYEKQESLARLSLSTESVSASAAQVTQARCEAVLRHIANEAVLRTAEAGKMRVDAATTYTVLRPFAHGMTFTAVLPPRGLIRHAQGQGRLGSIQADADGEESEKAENRELAAAARKIEKAAAEKKAERAKKRKASAEPGAEPGAEPDDEPDDEPDAANAQPDAQSEPEPA